MDLQDLAEAVADDAEDWTDTASIDDLDSAYNSRPQRSGATFILHQSAHTPALHYFT